MDTCCTVCTGNANTSHIDTQNQRWQTRTSQDKPPPLVLLFRTFYGLMQVFPLQYFLCFWFIVSILPWVFREVPWYRFLPIQVLVTSCCFFCLTWGSDTNKDTKVLKKRGLVHSNSQNGRFSEQAGCLHFQSWSIFLQYSVVPRKKLCHSEIWEHHR